MEWDPITKGYLPVAEILNRKRIYEEYLSADDDFKLCLDRYYKTADKWERYMKENDEDNTIRQAVDAHYSARMENIDDEMTYYQWLRGSYIEPCLL